MKIEQSDISAKLKLRLLRRNFLGTSYKGFFNDFLFCDTHFLQTPMAYLEMAGNTAGSRLTAGACGQYWTGLINIFKPLFTVLSSAID